MEYGCQLYPPSKFDKFRRKNGERIHRNKPYDVIYGRLKKGGAWIRQSFRYPSPLWTKSQARSHTRLYDGKFEVIGEDKSSMKKKTKRKVNPSRKLKDKMTRAVKLFRKFRGEEPEYVDKTNYPVYNVGLVIGKCDGILYTTRRDGRKEEYIHKFTKRARPLLCSSHDGKHVFLVGGNYNFTEDGIVDRKGKGR